MTQDGSTDGPAHIEDVARRAGVSTATVSRSLRGLDRVAPRTRERVARAAEELRYVASPAASQLASRRTHAVGVVVTTSGRWFWSEVVAGASPVLGSAGYDLLLYVVDDPQGRRQFFDLMPLRRRVDAVMVLSSTVTAREQEALRHVDVPIVVVGGRMTGSASVRIDDASAARTAARHLTALGHRDVVLVCSNASGPSSRRTLRSRRSGFERALAEDGVEGRVVSTHPGIDGGATAVEALLSRGGLPTALFAETDELAVGALRTLRRAGISVPGDMSVMGFDDHELASAVDLTTISSSPDTHGQSAAMQLLAALGPGPSRPVDVVLPTRLVMRGTTAPPSRAGASTSEIRRPGRSTEPDHLPLRSPG